MTETALDRFWDLVLEAIALNPDAFKLIQTLPLGTRTALLIVLIAGFSQAVGQSIVLFINRVKPIRCILSLLIASVLFAFTVGFWVLSTWLLSLLLFAGNASFIIEWRTLGLAYAPLMFSFLTALPYFGVPILVLLSIWTLLALVMGLQVALGLDVWQAFGCGALGWVVFQVLQRSIGRPATAIGTWLSNTAAGATLVTDIQGLERLLETGLQLPPTANQAINNASDQRDRG